MYVYGIPIAPIFSLHNFRSRFIHIYGLLINENVSFIFPLRTWVCMNVEYMSMAITFARYEICTHRKNIVIVYTLRIIVVISLSCVISVNSYVQMVCEHKHKCPCIEVILYWHDNAGWQISLLRVCVCVCVWVMLLLLLNIDVPSSFTCTKSFTIFALSNTR